MRKKIPFLVLFITTVVNAQNPVIRFGASRNANQNSQRIKTLLNNLRNNTSGARVIEFEAGEYLFDEPITVNASNVTFRGVPVADNEDPLTTLKNNTRDNRFPNFIILGSNNTRVNRNTGEVIFRNNNNNPIGTKDISFEDLIIDNNFRTKAGASGTIINNNDSQGTLLKNVTLKRSDFMGIAAFNGNACHGLIVRDSKFEDIFDTCIFIMNRSSVRYGSLIRALRAPFSVTDTVFDDGYAEGVNADNGNDFFTDAESLAAGPVTLLRNRTVTGGGKRHALPTNLRNSLIARNTFGRCQRWNIGMVQASNFKVINNRMNGPGAFPPLNGQARPENSNSSNFHFEQFTQDVLIEKNTIINNTDQRGSRITSSFISMSSNEGRQRLSNDPIITVVPGIGGVPPRTAPGFNNTFLRGTPGCRLNIRRDPNNLTCRREFHSYGPRNIIIRQNSFSTNVRVDKLVSFRDAINFTLENNNYRGATRNRPPGSVNGIGNSILNGNRLANDIIDIEIGEKGNCDIVISEPQFTQNIINNRIDIERNATLRGCANGISINFGPTLSIPDITDNEKNNLLFSVTPNPAKNNIIINGLTTLKRSTIEIYSMQGKVVKTLLDYEGEVINLSTIEEGIYLIKVTAVNSTKTLKLIKS